MSLTPYIEAGFQRKLKTSAVFIDLTAAYEILWRHGLLCKLFGTIPCQRIINLIDNMTGRCFRIVMVEKISNRNILNKGLTQDQLTQRRNVRSLNTPKTRSQQPDRDHWKFLSKSWRLTCQYYQSISTSGVLNHTFVKRKLLVFASTITQQMGNLRDTLRKTHNIQPAYLRITLDRTHHHTKVMWHLL